MSPHDKTIFQKGQIKVIEEIGRQVANNSLSFSTVLPVKDYGEDRRLCLTSVHFPKEKLFEEVINKIIKPLKKISPNHYFYDKDNLHMTIKNIRVISDPPNFTANDIAKVNKVFGEVIGKHKRFKVYFYRLMLFKSNLSLIGTTDEELDNIVLDLDRELRIANVSDDKIYANSKYFFSNMTLVRFTESLNREFLNKVKSLEYAIHLPPYTVDSVTLLTSSAVMKHRKITGTWRLV